MRIAEAFCKMRLSDFCSSVDIDRAIAVTVDSFVGSQKVSCKKALARAFAKYVLNPASTSVLLIAILGTR
jgi:DNA replication licensing factor MCM2